MIHPKCPELVSISAFQPRRLGGAEISYSDHPAAEVAAELSRLRSAKDGLEYRLSPWQWVSDEGVEFGWELVEEIERSLGE